MTASRIGAHFRLDSAVAVVTGGASGIGRATALALADAGAHVVIADRDQAASEEVASEIIATGSIASPLSVDVADEASVEDLFAEVQRRRGSINVLVNNAGIAIRKPAVELPLADWEKVVAVNMTGVFLCARVAARHMISSGKVGAIGNTASIMGCRAWGCRAWGCREAACIPTSPIRRRKEPS